MRVEDGHVPTSLETCISVRISFLPFVGCIMSCFIGGADNEDVICLGPEGGQCQVELISIS